MRKRYLAAQLSRQFARSTAEVPVVRPRAEFGFDDQTAIGVEGLVDAVGGDIDFSGYE